MIVDIVGISSKSTMEIVEKAVDFLKSQNFIPRYSSNIIGDDLLCINNDEMRKQNLIQAIMAEDSDVIWCLRGGYGAARVIPSLANITPKKQKLFIGFSDLTPIHIYMHQNWGWKTLHGEMLSGIVREKASDDAITTILKIIRKEIAEVTLPLEPLNNFAIDNIEGIFIGGNLKLIETTIGTKWQLDACNKILLLEDVDERGYKIDRMLVHLLQAGLLNEVRAIIFGEFSDGFEGDGKSLADEVIARFANEVDIPMWRCRKIGHIYDNWPAPLNSLAKIINNNIIIQA